MLSARAETIKSGRKHNGDRKLMSAALYYRNEGATQFSSTTAPSVQTDGAESAYLGFERILFHALTRSRRKSSINARKKD